MGARESLTFPELLTTRARTQPDSTVYVWLGEGEVALEQLTFGELARRAQGVAAGLSASVAAGERVVLLASQGLSFLIGFFGCLYAGVVPVPVSVPNRKRGAEMVRAIAADSGARFVLTTGQPLEELSQLQQLELSAFGDAPADFTPPPLEPQAIALLQYTSGSTREPRGVVVTHANLVANQRQVAACLGADESSVYVSWLPMFHDMGLGIALQAIWVGVRCVLMAPRAFFQEPLRWLRVLSAQRGTISGGPDSAYALCVERKPTGPTPGLDLSSWRTAFNGSEPIHLSTLERFAEAFAPAGFRREALQAVYGLAEATLLAASEPPGLGPVVRHLSATSLERDRADAEEEPRSGRARSLVSCGAPWPGSELAIIHPGTQQEAPAGVAGEVWIRGPSVARGYWNRPRETRDTFGLSTADGRGGFMRSGDLGALVDGKLFLLGRQSDVLRIDGRNHYPHDIETSCSTSHPALVPHACAAVLAPLQGLDGLVLIQEVARSALRRVDPAAVAGAIRRAVAERHRLQVSAVVLLKPSTLPRTTSGKVRRARCREAFLEQSLSALHIWLETTLEAQPLGVR